MTDRPDPSAPDEPPASDGDPGHLHGPDEEHDLPRTSGPHEEAGFGGTDHSRAGAASGAFTESEGISGPSDETGTDDLAGPSDAAEARDKARPPSPAGPGEVTGPQEQVPFHGPTEPHDQIGAPETGGPHDTSPSGVLTGGRHTPATGPFEAGGTGGAAERGRDRTETAARETGGFRSTSGGWGTSGVHDVLTSGFFDVSGTSGQAGEPGGRPEDGPGKAGDGSGTAGSEPGGAGDGSGGGTGAAGPGAGGRSGAEGEDEPGDGPGAEPGGDEGAPDEQTGADGGLWRVLREQTQVWGRRLVALAAHVLRYRYATAALLLLAVAALYGVAVLSRPSGEPVAEARSRVPVTTAAVACPAPGRSTVSALTPPGGNGGTGRAEVSSTKDGSSVASIDRAGVPWSRDVTKGPHAYAIRGQGALAAGLQVERTTYRRSGTDRGLAAVRCGEPGTDLWFVGPGPLEAKRIDLYLTNVDTQAATVDLTALSGEGPLDTLDGRGIPVGPGSTKVIRLGDGPEGLGEIVQTAQVLALRVQATTGRVAAAVRVRVDSGRGVDWLPVAGAPATTLTVPGVPQGAGTRRLLVAVPGQDDARIRVQVLTSSGAFAPEGRDTLDAPARTVTPLALERALSGKAAAVRLVSDRPIVAGLAVQRGDDVGYGTATPPLTASGGLVADNRFGSVLQLVAPEQAATVHVTTVDAQGRTTGPRQVRIAAGRAAALKASAPAGGDGFGLLIVPQPGSGPVHAARVLETGRDGRLFTVLPVVPAVTTLLLPPVADSQRSLIP